MIITDNRPGISWEGTKFQNENKDKVYGNRPLLAIPQAFYNQTSWTLISPKLVYQLLIAHRRPDLHKNLFQLQRRKPKSRPLMYQLLQSSSCGFCLLVLPSLSSRIWPNSPEAVLWKRINFCFGVFSSEFITTEDSEFMSQTYSKQHFSGVVNRLRVLYRSATSATRRWFKSEASLGSIFWKVSPLYHIQFYDGMDNVFPL